MTDLTARTLLEVTEVDRETVTGGDGDPRLLARFRVVIRSEQTVADLDIGVSTDRTNRAELARGSRDGVEDTVCDCVDRTTTHTEVVLEGAEVSRRDAIGVPLEVTVCDGTGTSTFEAHEMRVEDIVGLRRADVLEDTVLDGNVGVGATAFLEDGDTLAVTDHVGKSGDVDLEVDTRNSDVGVLVELRHTGLNRRVPINGAREGHGDRASALDCQVLVEVDRAVESVITKRDIDDLGALSSAGERVLDARESLEAALAINASKAAARNALAWTFYASGNSLEAITRLTLHDDSMRDRSEEDPDRLYAQSQIARIVKHEEKVAWTDRFERRVLRNGWHPDEVAGPRVRMADGAVVIGGSFNRRGRARVFREELAGNFVSFEAEVTVEPGALCRVGVFVSRERSRRGGLDVQTEVAVARHHDGSLQIRFLKRGENEQPWTDVPVVSWEAGQPTILRIERHGESSKTTFRILVDGVPVADGVRVPGIGATTEQLRFGVFAEGEPGRTAGVRIDNVEFIYRESG